jgi:hypothetical protein
MMEEGSTSETKVNFYQIARCNNAENRRLHTRRSENHIFLTIYIFYVVLVATLKIETQCYSETLVTTYMATRCRNTLDGNWKSIARFK